MEVLSRISDEDFIDLELSFSCFSPSYSFQTKRRCSRDDFEFQIMSSSKSSIINSFHDRFADELFHQGKLLPLVHLPPPLQNLRMTPQNEPETAIYHDHIIPSILVASTTTNTTPLDIDDDDEYCFFEWSSNDLFRQQQFEEKRSSNWSKRLYHKALKASKYCLRSLFTKFVVGRVHNRNHRRLLLLAKKGLNIFEKNDGCKKIGSLKDSGVVESHRRSFSGTIQRDSSTSSSGSSSSSSTPFSMSAFNIDNWAGYDLKVLKKSSNVKFEVENSIEGAIAHCKQSRML